MTCISYANQYMIANISRVILDLSVVLTRAVVRHLNCAKTVLVIVIASIPRWQALRSRIAVPSQTARTRARGRTTSIDMFVHSMEGQHEPCSIAMQILHESRMTSWPIASIEVRSSTHLPSDRLSAGRNPCERIQPSCCHLLTLYFTSSYSTSSYSDADAELTSFNTCYYFSIH